MARYKLTQAAMINDVRYEPGTEVEYDGIPGPHMEPLDDAAKKAIVERDKEKPPAIGLEQNVMQAHPTEVTRPTTEPAHRAEEKPEDKKPEEGRGGVPRRG